MEQYRIIQVAPDEIFNELIFEKKTFKISYDDTRDTRYNIYTGNETPSEVPYRVKEKLLMKLSEAIYNELHEHIEYIPEMMTFRYSLVVPIYLMKDKEKEYKKTIEELQEGNTKLAKDYYNLKIDYEDLSKSYRKEAEDYIKCIGKVDIIEDKLNNISFIDKLLLLFNVKTYYEILNKEKKGDE